MRISDWSSDVCSSDLLIYVGRGQVRPATIRNLAAQSEVAGSGRQGILSAGEEGDVRRRAERVAREIEPGITIYERSSVANGSCQIPAFIAVEPAVQKFRIASRMDRQCQYVSLAVG